MENLKTLNRRRLALALFISSSLALTACTLSGKDKEEDIEEQEAKNDNDRDKDGDKTGDEQTPTESPEIDEDLTVEKSQMTVRSPEGDLLMTLSAARFLLGEGLAEKYPKLAATLSQESDNRIADMEYGAYRMGEECLDQRIQMGEFAGDMTYWDETETSVLRFDDTLFVAEDRNTVYYGGAHGLDTIYYTNIDVETGEYVFLEDFITDYEKVAELIGEALVKEYPSVAKVEWTDDQGSDPEDVVSELVLSEMHDYYINCTMTADGFVVYFPPYELASYAGGEFCVTIDPVANKDCFDQKYVTVGDDRKDDVIYTVKDEEEITVEAREYETEFYPVCPSWDYYCIDGQEAEECHTVIEKRRKEKRSDWIEDDWLDNYGFQAPDMPYIDGDLWSFTPDMEVNGYLYQGLWVEYDPDGSQMHYDLSRIANGPDDETGEMSDGEMGPQFVRYAAQKDGYLYVELCYISYSADEPESSYIAKIDMYTGEVIWKSDPLVANAKNFVITDNAIICGYGFTNEDDYLYELDINTGETVNKIKLDMKPDYIIMSGPVLYVWAYDTAYEFDLSEG